LQTLRLEKAKHLLKTTHPGFEVFPQPSELRKQQFVQATFLPAYWHFSGAFR